VRKLKYLVVLISLCLFLGTAGSVLGQETDAFSKYEAKKKNPVLAVGAAWLVPSLGHAYANAWWPRGATFLGLFVVSVAIYVGSESISGALPLIGFRIWEFVDAYGATKAYNKRLAKKYSVQLVLYENKPYLQIAYRF